MKKITTSLVIALSLILMTTGVVGAVESMNFSIRIGNNLVSPPFRSLMSAVMLCAKHPEIYSISRQKQLGVLEYQEYICKKSRLRDSFLLNPKVGYFIRANAPFEATFSGQRVTDNYKYNVAEGWNLIGVPNADQYSLKAEGLCGNFSDTNLKIIEVDRYRNGGWDAHLCSEAHGTPRDMNNFDIVRGEGYAVKMVKR